MAVQDFIRDRFAAHYQADAPLHALPVRARGRRRQPVWRGRLPQRGGAAAEHYLDEPIEDLIAARVGTTVERVDGREVALMARPCLLIACADVAAVTGALRASSLARWR